MGNTESTYELAQTVGDAVGEDDAEYHPCLREQSMHRRTLVLHETAALPFLPRITKRHEKLLGDPEEAGAWVWRAMPDPVEKKLESLRPNA